MSPVTLGGPAPVVTPLALAIDFGVAAAVAFAVVGAAWVVSGARLHRADRIGAAALAVGFVAGYQMVTGGGWHPERPVTWLPLIVVAAALLGPRLAARTAPGASVPLAARAFVLVAASGAAVTTLLAGRTEVGALEACTLGAALGVTAGERLGDDSGEAGLGRPDRRPATWICAALLVGLVPALGA